MIDNIKKIVKHFDPLISDPDNVYLVYVSTRGGDGEEDAKLRAYRIGSAEEMLDKAPELKEECSRRNARLYIDFILKSREKLDSKEETDLEAWGDDRYNADYVREWVLVDVDTKDGRYLDAVIDGIRLTKEGDDVFRVETPAGYHVMAEGFNVNLMDREVKKRYYDFEHSIHSWTPMLLMYKPDIRSDE